MAIKKADDPTTDKNESTSDKGAKATNAEKNTTTASTKADDGKSDEGAPKSETTLNDKATASRDTSNVGEGDVANTDETKAKIAENKNGQTIASAPTEDADLVTVTESEAKQAVREGRPIPGVDLKPGDRPDVRTTRPEDVLNAGGTGYARHVDEETGDIVVSHRTPDGKGPRSYRKVRKAGEYEAKNVEGRLDDIRPTANYEKPDA